MHWPRVGALELFTGHWAHGAISSSEQSVPQLVTRDHSTHNYLLQNWQPSEKCAQIRWSAISRKYTCIYSAVRRQLINLISTQSHPWHHGRCWYFLDDEPGQRVRKRQIVRFILLFPSSQSFPPRLLGGTVSPAGPQLSMNWSAIYQPSYCWLLLLLTRHSVAVLGQFIDDLNTLEECCQKEPLMDCYYTGVFSIWVR